MDLFDYAAGRDGGRQAPLAVRMRPHSLEEFVGQSELVGPRGFLARAIRDDHVPSLIFYGPPGTGKTTLAEIIATATGADFVRLNAVTAGVADIRKVVKEAQDKQHYYHKRTILFIDEIHRFNKGQQDALLPYVEDGTITLVGATTETPFFEINPPLLSRAKVVRLETLAEREIAQILQRALTDAQRGLGKSGVTAEKQILTLIARLSGGDARAALNILEQAAALLPSDQSALTEAAVQAVVSDKIQQYDKSGDNHYDVISAFIKSMRGSDPDAALHYLARMLAAGEDVKFIARRVVICAAEDVGNADPQALVLAVAAAQAAQFVGLPEARIPLAQAVTYVACAPKSNAAYVGIDKALADVRTKDCGRVPPHLRDANYHGAAELGHGLDYKYPHDYASGFVVQQYMPDNLAGTVYYQPTEYGRERLLRRRLLARWPHRGRDK